MVPEYGTIPGSALLQNATSLTRECWLYPVPSANALASVINKGDGLSGASARSYELRWTADEKITASFFFAPAAGQPDFISVSAPVLSNQWTHVAAPFDSSSGIARLFTNGIIASEWEEPDLSLMGREIRQTTQPLVFGWAPNHSGTYMSGLLDEVRIWSRARSSLEVRADMACKLTGLEDGLAGYWNFDDLTADDQTGNENNGNLSGQATVIVRSTENMALIGCDPAVILFGENSFPGLRWRLKGRIGSRYLLQSATTLGTWADYVLLPGDEPTLHFETPVTDVKAFYRAVLMP